MKGPTHIAGGAVAGLLLASSQSLTLQQALPITATVMVASLIPDIDICTSKAGRMIPPASILIQLFIGHRTLFHSPLLYLAIYAAAISTYPGAATYIHAAAIGIISHLLLDMMNPAGVPLLWPIGKRFHIASFRSGGLFDWLLCGVLYLIAGYLFVRLYI